MNYQQIFAIIFTLVCIYSLVKTFKLLSKKIELRKNGVRTTATIIDFDKKEDNEGTEYFPILRFIVNTNNVVEKKVGEARGVKPKIGKEIIIFYDALNPDEITIDNKWLLYFNAFSIVVELYLILYFSYFVIKNKWLFQ